MFSWCMIIIYQHHHQYERVAEMVVDTIRSKIWASMVTATDNAVYRVVDGQNCGLVSPPNSYIRTWLKHETISTWPEQPVTTND